ncbi:hypothetical protein [Paenibacillus tyrfis]|uniref:hypothetical protein n=1 Tax=Paenibacillus tyrfis TaxID=1501230 RepID=UPI000B58E55C|nr:hypothetical protein [Paenibacillus tyrfis]
MSWSSQTFARAAARVRNTPVKHQLLQECMAKRQLQLPDRPVPAGCLRRLPRVLVLVAVRRRRCLRNTPVKHQLLQECVAKRQLQLPDRPFPAGSLRWILRVLVLAAVEGADGFVRNMPMMDWLLKE